MPIHSLVICGLAPTGRLHALQLSLRSLSGNSDEAHAQSGEENQWNHEGGVPLGFMVIVFLEADRQDWVVGRGVGKGVIEA